MAMLTTFLFWPVAPLMNPEDYLKASGEALALLFALVWVVTFVAAPTYHGDVVWAANPLMDRIGYINLCVGFDTRPAVYFAQVLWVPVAYLGLRFAWSDVVRSSILRQQGLINACQNATSNAFAVLYVASMACFGLVFIISPLEGANAVWYHSIPFMQLILVRCIVVVANFVKYRGTGGAGPGAHISTGAKVWLAVYSIVSVLYPLMLAIDYVGYDDLCANDPQYQCEVTSSSSNNATFSSLNKPDPTIPWWLTCILDYTWFLCLPLTTKFMPTNESIQLDYSWRSIEMDDRSDAHAGIMRPRMALPMEEQASTGKDSIRPSRLVACLTSCCAGGDQTGAYFADTRNVTLFWVRALFSKTGGAYTSCPFASSARKSATMHLGHGEVAAMLKAREAKLEGSEAVRRNDLGLFRLNSTMFPRTGAIFMNSSSIDHKVYRDFFGEGFSKLKTKPGLAQRLQDQVLSAASIDVSMEGDLAVWAIRELWSTLLDVSLSWDESVAWVAHQQKVVGIVVKPAKVARGGKALTTKLQMWLPRIRTALMENMGVADDAKKLNILADAVYDTLVFAGGLSVPMALISVTGLRMNGVVPLDYEIDPAKAQNFALEAVRCFPPVSNVSQWTKDGAQQTIAAIAVAMTDPGVFGAGFKCERPMVEFDEKGCSFAELAGRKYCCPGRTFALECIAAYALAFKPKQWIVHGAGPHDQTLLTKRMPPFFRNAVLFSRDTMLTQGDAAGRGAGPGEEKDALPINKPLMEVHLPETIFDQLI
mmetsp:Transcript_17766/g.35474  ORF Transcript_17766/g.35474 Transcript_17766/m.35474 type:complete len:764 (-) Transcript_17766:67-2358(-)